MRPNQPKLNETPRSDSQTLTLCLRLVTRGLMSICRTTGEGMAARLRHLDDTMTSRRPRGTRPQAGVRRRRRVTRMKVKEATRAEREGSEATSHPTKQGKDESEGSARSRRSGSGWRQMGNTWRAWAEPDRDLPPDGGMTLIALILGFGPCDFSFSVM